MHWRKLALVLALLLPTILCAKQLSFSRTQVASDYHFSYQWLDQYKQLQTLDFAINRKALFNKFRNFRNYKDNIAEQHILHSVRRQIRQQPFSGVQVHFQEQDNQTIIELTATNEQKLRTAKLQLTLLQEQATEQYLQASFYHKFTNFDQNEGIKPDHVRIANHSVVDLKPLKPIFLEKFSIKNIRNAANYTLGFVQSIPYYTLESRTGSSGTGFNPPLKLLYENQGDCDSKVTLTAALLRSLMPRVKMVMVFIDQHALIGISVKANKDDTVIEHEGITYVLGEPTGPALLSLGEVSLESDLAVANGHYVVENYHKELSLKTTD